MLVGTIMQTSRESNLLYQKNYAEKTSGAIFVVHPQMMINAHIAITLRASINWITTQSQTTASNLLTIRPLKVGTMSMVLH